MRLKLPVTGVTDLNEGTREKPLVSVSMIRLSLPAKIQIDASALARTAKMGLDFPYTLNHNAI